MSEAIVSVESGSVVSVVNESWLVEAPEKAVDGMPSFAASHAAPLKSDDQR